MDEGAIKRPTGLTVVSVLWLFFALFNVFIAFTIVSVDIEGLQYISGPELDPWVDPWFIFGIPVELAIAVIILVLGLLQIVTIAGLWTGKRYSFNLALRVPIAFILVNLMLAGLYLTAPSNVTFGSFAGISMSPVVFGMFWIVGIIWVIVYLEYLRKPHVKEFLGVAIEHDEVSRLEKYHYKYAILSSVIGSLVWILLDLVLVWYLHFNITFAPGIYLTDLMIPVAFIIGTYVGISVIGKIRKPSHSYALIIGLFSIGFCALFFIFKQLIYGILLAQNWGINWLHLFSTIVLGGVVDALILEITILPIIGVLIGVLLVRHSSPVTGTPAPS